MNVIVLLISFLFLSRPPAAAQTEDLMPPVLRTPEKELVPFADMMPEYPGGPQELYNFIGRNVRYPKLSRKKGIQGRAVITFVVDPTGRMRDLVIEESVSAEIDAEALRVMYLMRQHQRWIPGFHHGKPVDVKFTLPIRFVID